MPKNSVRIVIVNWNSGSLLKNCLDSIEAFGGSEVAEVVVVDNGSTDGSDRIDPAPRHRIIRAGANLGFARACNLGAEGAATSFLLFLNPDAEIRAGTVQTAVAFMASPQATRIAVCGIRLVGEDGKVQHHVTRFPLARALFVTEHRILDFDHLSSREVEHVIGAFYLIRREIFESVGGFDERFFVYLEDLDLSYRIAQAGWKAYYLAEAVGFHKGGGSSDQIKARRLFYSMRSRLLYASKHLGPLRAFLVLAATLTLEPPARVARALLRRSMREAAETLSAYRMLVGDLPAILTTMRRSPPSSRVPSGPR